jgi:RibD C-terminal domain
VVTHRPAETIVKRGGTSYIFVTEGIEHALARAREAAGSNHVQVNGGADIARQYLKLGAIDELRLHLVPLTMGAGTRPFAEGSSRKFGCAPSRPIQIRWRPTSPAQSSAQEGGTLTVRAPVSRRRSRTARVRAAGRARRLCHVSCVVTHLRPTFTLGTLRRELAGVPPSREQSSSSGAAQRSASAFRVSAFAAAIHAVNSGDVSQQSSQHVAERPEVRGKHRVRQALAGHAHGCGRRAGRVMLVVTPPHGSCAE